jgi:hypothetical protein
LLLAFVSLVWLAGCPGPSDGDADADSDGDSDTEVETDGDVEEECPADQECCRDQDCSNGIFCDGVERCDRGECEPDRQAICDAAGCRLVCDDGFACTNDVCDEMANVCVHQQVHDRCLDDDLCNGEERCAPGDPGADADGCIAGVPLICDDGDGCTDDYCEENVCLVRVRDADGDGFGDEDCQICLDPENPRDCERGTDCNDGNADVYPGAVEICDDGEDNNCDRARDYADPACTVPNDSCEDATLLEPGVTIHASTRRTLGDIASSCAPDDAGDVAFAFVLAETQDVEVTIAARSTRSVTVALTGDCDSAEGDIKCTTGRTFTQITRALGSGTYYIVVSSELDADFDITFTHADPVERPAGDQCASAIEVEAGESVSGTTSGFDADYTAGCGDDTDRDATFVFTLDETSAVDIDVGDATAPVAVAVQSTCGVPASEAGCFEGEVGASGRVGSLLPGTYYVIVKSPLETDFTLSIELSITSSDTCEDARDISAGGTFFGTTYGLTADIDTACGEETGPDSAYRFTIRREQDVTIDFRSAGEPTTLSLTSACGDPDEEVNCIEGEELQLRGRGLPAGSYSLVATGIEGDDFEFDISFRDPVPRPADDLCRGAIAIPRSGHYSGDTRDCENDYASRCGSATDLDTTYTFTLREPQSMDLTIEADSGPLTVAIQPDCGIVGTERSCFSTDGGSTHRYYRNLDAGTYYLVFKTPAADTFSFDVTFGPPEPTVIEPWIDTTGHTNHFPGGWGIDDSQFNVDIAPLTFPFNGEDYGCVAMSTNGYLRFGPAGSCPGASGYVSSETDIDEVFPSGRSQLSMLGTDGWVSESSAVLSYIDTALNRVIITYLDYNRLGSTTGPDDIQVILYCDTGDIQVSYGECGFDSGGWRSWAVGVSEPAHGGSAQPHDFTTHEAGSSVSFGPGAIYQSPDHTDAASWAPLAGHAIFYQRSGTGWEVIVDELPL